MTDIRPTLADPDPTSRSRTLLLAVVVGLAALAGVGIAAATDRLDTALLFVGVPCLLAFGIGLVRGRGGWGTVFQVLTVVLLLSAALLQEAAVCVLVAAPLVYGVAGLAYAVARGVAATRGRGSFAVVPVLAVVLLEGIVPAARIHPGQRAEAAGLVAARCADFESALARGPRPDPESDRGLLLDLFPYPTPTAATGTGLEVQDRWALAVGGGTVQTRVVSREASSVAFTVDADSSALGRWVTVHGGRLSWEQRDGACHAELTLDYERHLDPALWFGPVTEVFMDAGAAAFLAGLD